MATKKARYHRATNKVQCVNLGDEGAWEFPIMSKATQKKVDDWFARRAMDELITVAQVKKLCAIRPYKNPIKTAFVMTGMDEIIARINETKEASREALADDSVLKEMYGRPLTGAAFTTFPSGAFRDGDQDKIDFEGHLSPLALELAARYMHKHRTLKDGSRRASDNWQLGFDDASFVKSGMRHWMNIWKLMRGLPAEESLEDAIGAMQFNVNGLAHQFEKRRIEAARNPATDSASAKPAA